MRSIISTANRHTSAMCGLSSSVIICSITTHFLSNVDSINVNRSIIGKSRSNRKSTAISTNSQISNQLRFTAIKSKCIRCTCIAVFFNLSR